MHASKWFFVRCVHGCHSLLSIDASFAATSVCWSRLPPLKKSGRRCLRVEMMTMSRGNLLRSSHSHTATHPWKSVMTRMRLLVG